MNPSLQEEGKNLQDRLQQINPDDLQKELQKQIAEKFALYTKTIPNLWKDLDKYQRQSTDAPVIWQEGSTYLYGYEAPAPSPQPPAPVLIIPSLINRHYILDLAEHNSFVKYLARNNIPTFLIAWNEPLEDELNFSLDDYISRIGIIIDEIYNKTGQKIILTGYCMGGLLALAAALNNKQEKIKAISFLATPWDFHAGNFPRFIFNNNESPQFIKLFLENFGKVPASLLQGIFYFMYAELIGQKLTIYPLLNGNYSKEEFLAIEYWVNDGISMTKNVAKTCFIDWVHNNSLANLAWKVQDKVINPESLSDVPVFFALPKRDHIVPYDCALPLTKYFNNNTIIEPNSGHIGMLAGASAKTHTWDPFLNWVQNLQS